jgi:organic hydroperoxide reductase OsmC/OhrA
VGPGPRLQRLPALRKSRNPISRCTDARKAPGDDIESIDKQEVPMTVTKDFRYKVGVAWEGDRLTSVTSPDKPEITVATPPEFKNGVPGVWSPEDLLVASVASCYAVTLVAVAERRDLPLHELHVSGTGHLTIRDDGRLGFVAIELTVDIRTDEPSVEVMERTAHYAERACLVSMALDVPVHVEVVVRPVTAVLATV